MSSYPVWSCFCLRKERFHSGLGFSPQLVTALVAYLQTDWIQNPLSHVPVRAWNCTTICTGTCFPIQSISFSPLFFLVQTKHLWIQWEHKLKALGREVILQCCEAPSGTGCQAHSSKQKTLHLMGGSWNHSLVIRSPASSSPSLHPFSLSLLLVSLTASSSPSAASMCGCQHGVKQHCTSGCSHWHLSSPNTWGMWVYLMLSRQPG